MDIKSTQFRKLVVEKAMHAVNIIGMSLVISIGMVTVAAAHGGGYASDGNGNVLRDGNGNCVRAALGNPFPECEPQAVRGQDIKKPVEPKPVAIAPPPPKPVVVVPAPKPKPVVKVPPKPQVRYVTKTLSLNESAGANFGFDKDTLTNNAQQQLSSFAATVRNSNIKPSNVSVIGHTDSTGPESYNQTLSERRANSVASYLSTQGIDRRTMQISGRGETQPIANNKTRAGRAENRRVDIRVTGQRKITVKQ